MVPVNRSVPSCILVGERAEALTRRTGRDGAQKLEHITRRHNRQFEGQTWEAPWFIPEDAFDFICELGGQLVV